MIKSIRPSVSAPFATINAKFEVTIPPTGGYFSLSKKHIDRLTVHQTESYISDTRVVIVSCNTYGQYSAIYAAIGGDGYFGTNGTRIRVLDIVDYDGTIEKIIAFVEDAKNAVKWVFIPSYGMGSAFKGAIELTTSVKSKALFYGSLGLRPFKDIYKDFADRKTLAIFRFTQALIDNRVSIAPRMYYKFSELLHYQATGYRIQRQNSGKYRVYPMQPEDRQDFAENVSHCNDMAKHGFCLFEMLLIPFLGE